MCLDCWPEDESFFYNCYCSFYAIDSLEQVYNVYLQLLFTFINLLILNSLTSWTAFNKPLMISGSTLPLSALRLLVPPVQLLSAAIWQTVQQKSISDYGLLEEFVFMVTETVPQLLSTRQRAELILGLRARVRQDWESFWKQIWIYKNKRNLLSNFVAVGAWHIYILKYND